MTIKVCFDFICDEALLFSGAAKLLAQRGYDVSGYVMGQRWKQGWEGIFPVFKLRTNGVLGVEQEYKRIEAEYGQYLPASFPQSDRFLSKKSRQYQRQVLVNCFVSFEDLVEHFRPDVIISTGVAYLYNLVALSVCSKKGVKHISLYPTRQPISSFTYSTGTGGRWEYLDKLYEEYKEVSIDDSGLNLEEEKKYLGKFREEVKKPDYMNLARQLGGLRIVFVKELLVRLHRWYLEGWGFDKDDYISQHPLWYAKRDLFRIVRRKYLDKFFKFDMVNSKDRYYIFPLHLQPEASTLVLSKYYVNQLEVIKNISKVIPLDTYLYVKEHPAAYGRNARGLYEELKRIHNVKIISPTFDSKNLIINSRGVIVLSGTMGWEAMLLGVPVFVFGDVFYGNMVGVRQVEGYDHLGEQLRLENAANDYSALIALKAIKDAGWQGVFDVHKLDSSHVVLSEENVRKVAHGIKNIISLVIEKI